MNSRKPERDLSLRPKPADPFKAPKARRVRSSPVDGLAHLADLTHDPENPREIDPENAEGLSYSLESFGDLSGIVFNLTTRQLVTGHQRTDRLFQAHGNLPIRWEGGRAFLVAGGEEFPIRLVSWPLDKQRAANLAANSPHLAGRYTKAAQTQLEAVRAKSETMFQALKLHKLQPLPAQAEPNKAKLRLRAEITCPHCGKPFPRD